MEGTRGRRGLRLGIVVAGVVAAVVLLGEGRAPAAGTVCGDLPPGLTTWTAADSPVSICGDGIRVPVDATLVVDAALGPVTVASVGGDGGIDVLGMMRTTNTAVNKVTFTGPTSSYPIWPWSWRGIRNYGSLTLTNAAMSWAGHCVRAEAGAAQVTDTSFDHCSTGFSAGGGSLDVQGGTVSNGFEGAMLGSAGSVRGVTFRNLAYHGVRIELGEPQRGTVSVVGNTLASVGTGGWSPIKVGASTYPHAGLVLQDNHVSDSGAGGHPTIDVWGTAVDIDAITGNTGTGNGLDVVHLNGVTTVGFTWVSPTAGPGPVPLGHVIGAGGLTLEGEVIVPADALVLVNGPIEVLGGHLNATAGGAVFTSASDTTEGFAACPSAIALAPCDPENDEKAWWHGILLNGEWSPDRTPTATIHGAEIRYAHRCIEGRNPVPPALPPPTPPPDEPPQLVLSDTTVAHCYGAITARYMEMEMTGGAIVDAKGLYGPGTTPIPGHGIKSVGAALSVRGTAISRTEREAVDSNGRGLPVVLNDLVVDQANPTGAAVRVASPGSLQMKGTVVTRSGTSSGSEAVIISGYAGDLASDLAGLAGGGNGYDAVVLTGSTALTDLTWRPVSNSPVVRPLGYLNGGLTMRGAATLTVPPGTTFVSVNELALEDGARLDAPGGGALFTDVTDPTNGQPRCRAETSPVVASTHVAHPTASCLGTGLWWGVVTHGPVGGSVTMTGATVRRANVAISGRGAVTLRETVIERSGQAIFTGGPLSITGGRIRDLDTARGSAAVVSSGPTSITSVTFSDIVGHAVHTSGNLSTRLAGVSIVGNTFERTATGFAYGYDSAISAHLVDRPTITDNTIRGSATPIGLRYSTVDLNLVVRNQGAGNEADAIFLSWVTTTTPWVWATPTNSTALHPLGHVIFRGDLIVAPGSSLTVPANGVVSSDQRGIVVNGTLTAAAGSRFTALCDSQSSMQLYGPCDPTAAGRWSGVTLHALDDAPTPTATFTDTVIRGATAAVTVDHSVPGDAAALRFSGGRITNSDTAFALRGGTSEVTGVAVAPAPGSGDAGMTGPAVVVGLGASLTADRIEVASGSDYAVTTAGALTLTCANLHGNRGGLDVSAGRASVHDSDLGGNAGLGRYDIAAVTPTSATRNWWGQAGGPRAGQVFGPVDTSNPLAAPSDCAPGSPWTRPAGDATPPPPPSPATSPPPSPSSTPAPSGYWMLGQDGVVYAFGDAAWHGNANVAAFGSRAVDIDSRRDNAGYWVVDSAGRVFAFGSARWLGNVGGLGGGERATSLAGTLTGNGYFVFTDRGRAFPFGDAVGQGDMSGSRLNGPVIDAAVTGAGDGYHMVGADGGVFAFNGRYAGSMGGHHLNRPVVGMSGDPDNAGYWLVAADGGIFAFDSAFRGSMGGKPLNSPVVGMVPYGDGYLMVAGDGGIFNFSSKPFRGSLGGNPPSVPITSVAPVR